MLIVIGNSDIVLSCRESASLVRLECSVLGEALAGMTEFAEFGRL